MTSEVRVQYRKGNKLVTESKFSATKASISAPFDFRQLGLRGITDVGGACRVTTDEKHQGHLYAQFRQARRPRHAFEIEAGNEYDLEPGDSMKLRHTRSEKEAPSQVVIHCRKNRSKK